MSIDSNQPPQFNPDNAKTIPPQDPCQYRQVASNSGLKWLIQAIALFKLSPGNWILSILIMSLILTIMLLIPVIQFFAIIATPVFTAGLMFSCQKLARHQSFSLKYLFKGFEQQFNSLLMVGLIYLGCTLVCSIIAAEISTSLGYPLLQVDPEKLTNGTFDIEAFMASLVVPSLVMMLLMLPVAMAYWFAPALVMLRKVAPVEAMKKSFHACRLNVLAFLIYAIAALALLILILTVATLIASLIPGLSILLALIANFTFMSIFFASIFTAFEDIFAVQSTNKVLDDDETTMTV